MTAIQVIAVTATFLAAITEVSRVAIRLQCTSFALMGPICPLESLQISREKTLKEKHAASKIPSTREKWDIALSECFYFLTV